MKMSNAAAAPAALADGPTTASLMWFNAWR